MLVCVLMGCVAGIVAVGSIAQAGGRSFFLGGWKVGGQLVPNRKRVARGPRNPPGSMVKGRRV